MTERKGGGLLRETGDYSYEWGLVIKGDCKLETSYKGGLVINGLETSYKGVLVINGD